MFNLCLYHMPDRGDEARSVSDGIQYNLTQPDNKESSGARDSILRAWNNPLPTAANPPPQAPLP